MKCLCKYFLFLLFAFTEVHANQVNLEKINELLRKDHLEKEIKQKNIQLEKKKLEQLAMEKAKYGFPSEQHFWPFFSKFWLVENVNILKWDFDKPNLGLLVALKQLLSDLQLHQWDKSLIDILVVNNPGVFYFPLPGNSDHYIILHSLPFINNLNLSKRDLAFLSLESLVRSTEQVVTQFVADKDLIASFGTNFYSKNSVNKKSFFDPKSYLGKMGQAVFSRGFTFAEQYQVINKMNGLLKSNPKILKEYIDLYRRIDVGVRVNKMVAGINKIYPSPEIILKWLEGNN